jgi:hypothetical protein
MLGGATWFVTASVQKAIAPVELQRARVETTLENLLTSFSTALQIHPKEDEIKHRSDLHTRLHGEESNSSLTSSAAITQRISQLKRQLDCDSYRKSKVYPRRKGKE